MTQAEEVAAASNKLYEQLKKVRASKTLELRPTPLLKTEIIGFDGNPQPFRLRYYQSQGIFHMLLCPRMVLGDGTGLGKCETLDTLVLTSDGLCRMRDLAPESLDLSKAEEGFYPLDREVSVWTGDRMSRVSQFYYGAKKPTLRVTTRNGFQIEASLVHPLRARRSEGESWVQTRDLREGDFLCVPRTEAPFPTQEPRLEFEAGDLDVNAKVYSYPKTLTPPLATLLGYIVAEGHSTKYRTCVTQHRDLNPEPHDEIRRLFLKIFGWEGNFDAKTRDTSIDVPSIGIREFLRSVGIGDELSREKFVPPSIFRGTREAVRGFLSAMIEAEGSVADGGVEFTSSSARLAREVQILLLRFGVVSTLSEKHIKDNDHTYWRLTFFGDDARRFLLIGFRSARKNEALITSLKATSNPNKDLVPHASEIVAALKKRILQASSRTGANDNRKGSGIKQFGESFQSTLKHILNGNRDPSYAWLLKLMGVANQLGLSSTQEYEAVLDVYNRRHFYDPIVKIEASEAEVADIEVDDPEHCYVANGLLSHNTVQTIGTFCYLWERDPKMKVLVACPKSAIRQWAAELKRFTNGVKVYVAAGTLKERTAAYDAWEKEPQYSVLITNYHAIVRDWDYGATAGEGGQGAQLGLLNGITLGIPNLLTVFDECTAFKNPATKTHQTSKFLSDRSKRCYGLTATLLKNNLIEGFGIYKVVSPPTFTSKYKFMNDYCVTELKRVKGGAKIPIVIGYKNLATFRQTIDPVFYGRPKHMVSDELPALTTREVICELSPAEEQKYDEALKGLLELGDGETKNFEDTRQLTSLIYCQEAADSLSLLKFKGGEELDGDVSVDDIGSKEQALLDLLTEELEGEKVIIYTRFERLVTRLQELLKKAKIKSVRITGKESDVKRQKAQEVFQKLDSDTSVVFITDAGSEAINLQASVAMIFFDTPWSWGNYVQLLGRMIRIGSPHQSVYAIHLIARRKGKDDKKCETIDHMVVAKLRKKKGLIDQVIGEAAIGALSFERGESGLGDLIASMRENAT